jgi:hypothetical protein
MAATRVSESKCSRIGIQLTVVRKEPVLRKSLAISRCLRILNMQRLP